MLSVTKTDWLETTLVVNNHADDDTRTVLADRTNGTRLSEKRPKPASYSLFYIAMRICPPRRTWPRNRRLITT